MRTTVDRLAELRPHPLKPRPVTLGKIAALTVARKRPEQLRTAITSLWDRAKVPNRVQVIVNAEPDDPDTVEVGNDALAWVRRAPVRLGWGGIHHYMSAMAAMTDAEWFLLWTDDAEMLTDGWDQTVDLSPAGFVAADTSTYGISTHPIVHRSVIEAVGWPPTPHYDVWLEAVCKGAKLWWPSDIQIRHTDPASGGKADATHAESQAAKRNEEYFSPRFTAQRERDAEKLYEHFSGEGETSWPALT